VPEPDLVRLGEPSRPPVTNFLLGCLGSSLRVAAATSAAGLRSLSRHFFLFVNHDGAPSDHERQTIIDGCRYERKPHASARRCACPFLSSSRSPTYRLSHIDLACCPRNLGSASDGGRAPKSSEDLAGQRGHLGHRGQARSDLAPEVVRAMSLLRERSMADLLECFKREEDGSWTSTQPLSMTAGTGMRLGVSAGRNFKPGDLFFGMDLVAELDATTQGPSSNEQ
jgi:hypothetical protein